MIMFSMIDTLHVSKSYEKGHKAVDDLSLKVPDGTIFGFLGPNGAGKSTTIKMLVGLLLPDEGRIVVDGHDVVTDALKAKQVIGYVPDEPLFYGKMTGMEHLSFIRDIYRVKNAEEKVKALAALFDLKPLGDRIETYSHGMKQKLAVMSALLHDPHLLILDEPMVGLDPKSAFTMKQVMRNYAKEGNTVFFSTHVLEVAQEVCDEVGIISGGKLLCQGSMEELVKGENLEQFFLNLTEDTDA